jgi:hypothetical protein
MVKLSQEQAVVADRFVRCRGSHIFHKVGSQMVDRLSALRAGRPLTTQIYLSNHFCYRLSIHKGLVRLERLDK